ncbi:hypothetical protein CesoFtcFv8_026621 [Champsocephalus esox]|uniref:Uncharacterized protein n=2 Tax=Champsocephalus TaxID=52236 RepID=A0AAN8BXP4_CHAGU|nr:hypothetical protein CesoFtcFv8_026621 [Champsocephalus esox]KAK5893189.1 hypothetical protein CgunFtcFv8_006084 [Champsocephalus gunnari]
MKSSSEASSSSSSSVTTPYGRIAALFTLGSQAEKKAEREIVMGGKYVEGNEKRKVRDKRNVRGISPCTLHLQRWKGQREGQIHTEIRRQDEEGL